MASYLVTALSEATELIQHYNSGSLPSRAEATTGYARNWYAMKNERGEWIFGPANYVGWVGNIGAATEASEEKVEGRKIEGTLSEWFEEIGENHPLSAELKSSLKRFVASRGKTLHRLARIHVLKKDIPAVSETRSKASDESWRITANSEILGGKPCIRGIRIRVADILEMLADGAARQDILDDFPYLEDGDITAALEYAVASVDHRLIKAA